MGSRVDTIGMQATHSRMRLFDISKDGSTYFVARRSSREVNWTGELDFKSLEASSRLGMRAHNRPLELRTSYSMLRTQVFQSSCTTIGYSAPVTPAPDSRDDFDVSLLMVRMTVVNGSPVASPTSRHVRSYHDLRLHILKFRTAGASKGSLAFRTRDFGISTEYMNF
ncbi:hypothetical protein EVAR_88960_1 [Eumeta japonica]|uniref:Uncharacterized protein n=1 Tax=Eumeta variegata TaxID=151549 RepID=A0A4C1VRT9_EUMVA|nr:hypothetical protein EVAR_88960_1 [Eumeta japonica]